jgi:hypothetical protein
MRKERVLYHFVDVHDMVSFRVVDKLSMTEKVVCSIFELSAFAFFIQQLLGNSQ